MQVVRYHDGYQFRIAVPVPYNGRKFLKVLVVECNDKRGPHLRLRKVAIDERLVPVDYGRRQERKMRASLRRLAKKSHTGVKAVLSEVLS